MLLCCTGLSVLLLGLPVSSSADAQRFIPAPKERQLTRISAADADALISKLKEAQTGLRNGKSVDLLLMSGSLADLDAAKLFPRDAFLKIPFGEVWHIERLTTGTQRSRQFKLAYAPKGLGQLYWNIEVIYNIDGRIARVTMTYEPPAPF